jgi:hypothetical protein
MFVLHNFNNYNPVPDTEVLFGTKYTLAHGGMAIPIDLLKSVFTVSRVDQQFAVFSFYNVKADTII